MWLSTMISVGRSVGPRERIERAIEHLEVVRVADARHIPAVGDEACRHVLAERQRRRSLDRDPVVVVDPAQVAELEVAGERGRLARDAFHHAAVAGERVNVVAEQIVAGTVEGGCHPLRRDRHPDARRHSLPQRTGRGLDSRSPSVLRMAWTTAVELTEMLDVVERDRQPTQRFVLRIDRLDAGQMQHRIEQHRGMPRREDEAIAIGPDRIVGIEIEVTLPQRVDDRRHRHRGSRMTGTRLLHRVHRQGTNRIDAEAVERLSGRRSDGHRSVPALAGDLLPGKREF